jgi:phosphoribosylglycinamide formyltransferase-1
MRNEEMTGEEKSLPVSDPIIHHPLTPDSPNSMAPATSTPAKPPRLTVMLSGSGRTLDNLFAAIRDRRLDATITCVIASRETLGAQKARAANIPTLILPGVVDAPNLERTLDAHHTDWVILAGYLKYLNIPPKYAGRVVNIHPSLLPAFGGPGMYGDKVHAAVLAAGARTSGCTVHLVDSIYDHGQILLQRSCPVLPTDDPHTLAARVFAEECAAYPEALQQLFSGAVHNKEPLA